MKVRVCFVIRKQRDEHVRDGRPKKWIAACQVCGRAYMAPMHSAVLAWTEGHRLDSRLRRIIAGAYTGGGPIAEVSTTPTRPMRLRSRS